MRRFIARQSRKFDMMGRLHADIFFQDRYMFFCLLNGASFLYLACLWTLLWRKTGAFAMSFGRVCDVKRVFAALFRRKMDVFAVFVLIVQLVEGHFCLLNGASFVYLACLWTLLRRKTDAFAMSFERVCGVKRVCLQRFFSAKRTCLRFSCW